MCSEGSTKRRVSTLEATVSQVYDEEWSTLSGPEIEKMLIMSDDLDALQDAFIRHAYTYDYSYDVDEFGLGEDMEEQIDIDQLQEYVIQECNEEYEAKLESVRTTVSQFEYDLSQYLLTKGENEDDDYAEEFVKKVRGVTEDPEQSTYDAVRTFDVDTLMVMTLINSTLSKLVERVMTPIPCKDKDLKKRTKRSLQFAKTVFELAASAEQFPYGLRVFFDFYKRLFDQMKSMPSFETYKAHMSKAHVSRDLTELYNIYELVKPYISVDAGHDSTAASFDGTQDKHLSRDLGIDEIQLLRKQCATLKEYLNTEIERYKNTDFVSCIRHYTREVVEDHAKKVFTEIENLKDVKSHPVVSLIDASLTKHFQGGSDSTTAQLEFINILFKSAFHRIQEIANKSEVKDFERFAALVIFLGVYQDVYKIAGEHYTEWYTRGTIQDKHGNRPRYSGLQRLAHSIYMVLQKFENAGFKNKVSDVNKLNGLVTLKLNGLKNRRLSSSPVSCGAYDSYDDEAFDVPSTSYGIHRKFLSVSEERMDEVVRALSAKFNISL